MLLLYEPLDKADDEFRLLTLHASPSNGPIVCTLTNKKLGRYSVHENPSIYRQNVWDWKEPSSVFAGALSPGTLADDDKTLTMLSEPEIYPNTSLAVPPEAQEEGAPVLSMPEQPIELPFRSCDSLPKIGDPEADWVPQYEALSYTWGPQSPTVEITINEQPFAVRENLYNALTRLRRSDKHRVLWIDAICINQEDIIERSDQVQRMRSIYQRAETVLIWLGESYDNSDLAFEALELLTGTDQQRRASPGIVGEWYGPQYDLWWALPGRGDAKKDQADLLKYMNSLGLRSWQDISEKHKLALKNLLRRDYWKRVWCIQEVGNAQTTVILCGGKSIDWTCFEWYLYNDKVRGDPDGLPMTVQASDMNEMLEARWKIRDPMRYLGFDVYETFLQTIDRYREHIATDPRDKVYALLGLPSSDNKMALQPDYNKSVPDAYREVARTMINHRRDLSVLTSVHHDKQNHYALPSWVPDWSLPPSQVKPITGSQASKNYAVVGPDFPMLQPSPFCHLDASPADLPALGQRLQNFHGNPASMFSPAVPAGENGFNFSGLVGRPSSDSQPPVISISPNILHIDVFLIDRLQWLGDPIPSQALNDDSWKAIITSWQAALEAATEADGPYQPTICEDWDRLWPVLLKGRFFGTKDHPTEDWHAVYRDELMVFCGRLTPEARTFPELADGLPTSFVDQLKGEIRGWKLARTSSGELVLVPSHAVKDDRIILAFGADVPLIVRHTAFPRCKLVGSAYVPSLMHGQMVDRFEAGEAEMETIELE